ERNLCVCRPQPGGDRGQNHVHLRSAGDGRRLREAGRWRSAGSGQTGETHFCQCLDQLQQKLHPQQIPKIQTNLSHRVLQVLINIGEILKAAGCDYSNVVKTTVLLADINDFNNVNEVYKTFFSSNFPARAAYQVAALPRGGLVEIEAIAVLGPVSDS
uniref:Reactive intermediate imine deaminase A homolog n=1 Tax=Neolamprologus brichardi TaxID=32507 RepID=A0A3Q4H6S7_NEOBR